jgi:hypothetical protein
MRGKYFESSGDANELDLAQAAREFALTGRACRDRLRALWMIASRAAEEIAPPKKPAEINGSRA